MIRKIVLENFMAHGRTELELGPGLTALTGPNNSGKSAVVEALRCVATNPVPKYFIRHGAKEARVEVWLEDGTCIAWVRRKAHAIYEILRPGADEPEVYAKFGRKIPDDVADLLRLDPVELESDPGNPVDVHIGNQRSPIFIMADTSSDRRMADFFASSTESAHLLSMQKLLEKRVKDEKRVAAAQRERMATLAADLGRMGPLPDIGLRLDRAREAEAALAETRRSIPELERLIGQRRALALRERAGTLRLERLTPLDAIRSPRLWPVTGLAEWLHRRGELARERELGAARSGALGPLAQPPALLPAPPLARMVESLRDLHRQRRTCVAQLAPLAEVPAPPPLFDCLAVAERLGALRRLREQHARQTDRTESLRSLRPVPQLADPALLADLRGRLDRLRGERNAAARTLADLDGRTAELHARIKARLKNIGECPLCGGDLDAARFLRKGEGR